MEDLKTSHRLFHSFCTKSNTRFDSQGDDEEILLILRSHPITLLPILFNGLFLLIIVLFTAFFISSFLSMSQIIFLNLFFLLCIGNYVWFGFLNWYFNVGIVTNQKVVDVDFNVILYKEVSYTMLDNIEDVTAKSGGFFESVFNYGNLFIQTAGAEVNTEFLNIPHPSAAAKIIDSVIASHEKPHG